MNLRKVSCCVLLSLCVGMALRGENRAIPAPDANGVVTLSVESGTATYDSGSIPSTATKLIKTGAGTAKITVNSPNFTGPTEIQGGTLTLTTHGALGPYGKTAEGGDIEVWNNATLHLNWPGIAQGTYLWQMRTVKIIGSGSDGSGALKIEPTAGEGQLNDHIIGTIELAGDAVATSTKRWGFSSAFKLNQHTFTRNGAGTMMLLGKLYGPGNIVFNSDNASGADVAIFQGGVSFEGISGGNSTITCNNGARVAMYQVANPIPFDFVLVGPNARVYAQNNGTKPNENRKLNVISGKVMLPAQSTLSDGVYTYTQSKSDGSDTYSTWSGKVEQQSLFVKAGAGTLIIDGEFEGFAADGDGNKRVQISQGGLIFGENAKVKNTFLCNYNIGIGSVMIEGGQLHFLNLSPAYGSKQKPMPTRITGGDVRVVADFSVASSSNQCAELCIEGGRFVCSNKMYVTSTKDFTTGFLVQRGGLIETPIASKVQSYGAQGYTFYYQCGGTNNACNTGRGSQRVLVNEHSGSAVMALMGTNSLFKTEHLCYAYGDEKDCDFNLSVSDGATLSLDKFYRNKVDGTVAHSQHAYVYVNGGIWDVRTSNGLTTYEPDTENFFKANPDHFVVGPKGWIIETKDCYQSIKTDPWTRWKVTIPFDVEKPSGLGISEIKLPTTDAFKALTYYSSARIEVEGDGFGAAAFADWDFEKSALVVRITNPGCGYTKEKTTVKIQSPDLETWHVCEFELAAQKCGPVVVRGESGAMLYGRANTFDGGIVVEKGSYLRVVDAGSFPTGNPLTVYGEFNMYTNDLVVSSLAGNGKISCTGVEHGNVVLAADGEIHIKASELFAGSSTALSLPRRLTLSAGVKVVVDDVENLPESAEYAAFLTAGNELEIVGAGLPALVDSKGESLGDKWCIRRKNAGKTLCCGTRKGIMLIVR